MKCFKFPNILHDVDVLLWPWTYVVFVVTTRINSFACLKISSKCSVIFGLMIIIYIFANTIQINLLFLEKNFALAFANQKSCLHSRYYDYIQRHKRQNYNNSIFECRIKIIKPCLCFRLVFCLLKSSTRYRYIFIWYI